MRSHQQSIYYISQLGFYFVKTLPSTDFAFQSAVALKTRIEGAQISKQLRVFKQT
jgi:hypothetical protein